MDSIVGTDVAGYCVEALLGRGGMGVVYRARQRSLDRLVALKVIAPELAQEPRLRERFVRESRLAASIDHPNVIPIYEADQRDGQLYIAMRYVEGADLKRLLAESGPLPPPRAAALIAQVAAGLDAAHAQGLVHRDVKPANVLVTSGDSGSGHAYLTDFGLVKRTASESGLTEPGTWAGTLDYVAPEQLRGDPVDARADVYALGCLLFEALTGQVPFPRDSDVAKLWAHLSDPPPALAQVAPELPHGLDAVVARALAKDPGDRYAAAGLLALALTSSLTGTPGDTAPPRSVPRTRTQSRPEERKVVTVVSVDVRLRSEDGEADPEDVRSGVRTHHARVAAAIERYGGTIETAIGDQLVAVFGAPSTHEDDAERAVWAALRIDGREEGGLTVTAGIATGEALVSAGTAAGAIEATVAGAVVSAAVRLQGAAPLGSVAVDERTFRATREAFEFEALAPVTIRGRSEPVEIWSAIRQRARPSGGEAQSHGTPFVGREVERTLLHGLFDRCSRDRQPHLITVIGEPGVGKSRLVDELSAYVDARPDLVVWRRGRCLPYGDGNTFWAFGEVVKAHAGIFDTDPADVAVAKLDAVLPEDGERAWLRERLLPLLGIESTQALAQEESFAAWRRFLEQLAAKSASVIVMEDLHWADPALLDFAADLARLADSVPLLLVCTARPELYEHRPDWGRGDRNATTISLAPLSDADTATLLAALIPGAGADVEREIVRKAGGNPLYAEEFARLLSDARSRGTDVEALTAGLFPGRVQALIAARLDSLPPDRKRVLHGAAVVGEVFWAGALSELTGSGEEVERALHELTRREFVRPVRGGSMEGEAEYAFSHALVRDVAYSQIPRVERARQHHRAALWIEKKAGARVEDVAELLAHHALAALALAASDDARRDSKPLEQDARRFLRLAGERAVGLDTAHAEARFAQALELCPRDDPDWPELLVRWAHAAAQAGENRRTQATLAAALPRLREAADPRILARALLRLARLSLRLGEGDPEALIADAVGILERQAPGRELIDAYCTLADFRLTSSDPVGLIELADRTLDLAGRLGLPTPASLLGDRGLARMIRHDSGGVADVERALELLDERGHGHDAAVLQLNFAHTRYASQGPAATLAANTATLAFCESRGLVDMARGAAGSRLRLLVELGRPDEALTDAARLLLDVETAGDVVSRNEALAVEVMVAAERGDTSRSVAACEQLLTEARQSTQLELIVTGLARCASAFVAGAPSRAATLVGELAELAGAGEMPDYLPKLPATVRAALRVGVPDQARRLAERVEATSPLGANARRSAEAALAEHNADIARAASLYADAAERWDTFGNVPERAYALLGAGRCLGGSRGRIALEAAGEIFARLDYRPALAEVNRLLA